MWANLRAGRGVTAPDGAHLLVPGVGQGCERAVTCGTRPWKRVGHRQRRESRRAAGRPSGERDGYSIGVSEQRAYWLDLFTWKTWQEFLAAGASVSGFRQSRWGYVKQMKPGDYLLCYLVGISRFIAILEVTSPPYSDEATVIWSEDTFPARVHVKVELALDAAIAVPVHDLLERFSWAHNLRTPQSWTGHFWGSPARMKAVDGELVVAAMRSAKATPVTREVDDAKLNRQARRGVRQPPPAVREEIVPLEAAEAPVEEAPTIEPEATAPAAPAPIAGDEEGRTLVEVKAHTEIEGLLLELGSAMGLQLWVDRGDRGQQYHGKRLGDVPGVVDELPVQFAPEMVRRIERIDVLWLRDDAIIAAFEVEATTAVYSGLLRMADLLALQPNMNIPLYIVAPEERRGKVREEINRPTFSRALRKPLARSCRYVSFSRLREDAARLGAYVRVVKPEEFVEALSESFDNGA